VVRRVGIRSNGDVRMLSADSGRQMELWPCYSVMVYAVRVETRDEDNANLLAKSACGAYTGHCALYYAGLGW
jgi:hypothetical protein